MKTHAIRITREGLKQLKLSLARIEDEIEQAADTIREANDSANEDGVIMATSHLQQLEAKRSQLQRTLQRAAEIKKHRSELIELGSTVQLATEAGSRRFTLVHSAEADPSSNRISPESPLGHSLLHHRSGEEVTVHTCGKTLKFHILRVE